MPRPGSNKYDRQEHRIQRHLEEEGFHDEPAAEGAEMAMSEDRERAARDVVDGTKTNARRR